MSDTENPQGSTRFYGTAEEKIIGIFWVDIFQPQGIKVDLIQSP